MELRPYQEAARTNIHDQWASGVQRTLLVLPTGTGKTIVFAAVTEDEVRAGNRVLILAHRGELLEQAADKIKKSTGLQCAVEKAESSCRGSWLRITVGSVQSLQRPQRLEQFPHDYFGTIVIDEAHHAITDGYRRILDWFDEAHVLGVTATAPTLKEALCAAYEKAEKISFNNAFYRKDIGLKALNAGKEN